MPAHTASMCDLRQLWVGCLCTVLTQGQEVQGVTAACTICTSSDVEHCPLSMSRSGEASLNTQLTAHAHRDKPSQGHGVTWARSWYTTYESREVRAASTTLSDTADCCCSHCFASMPATATSFGYMLAPFLQNTGTVSLSTWPATFSSSQLPCPYGQGANLGKNCRLPDPLDEKGGLRLGQCTAGGNKLLGLSSSSTLALDLGIPWGHLGPVGAELCATALWHQQVYNGSGHTKCLQSHDFSLFLPLWVDSYDSDPRSHTSAEGTSLVSSDCSIGQDWPFDPSLGVTTTACLQLCCQGYLQSSSLYSTKPSLAPLVMHTFAACPHTHSQPAWPPRAHSSIG